MQVNGRFYNLQLHTQDGSVDLDVQKGSRLASGWRVETGDGSVHLTVPKDLAADLELRTGDGHIRGDLPVSLQSIRNDHDCRATLNGGGPPLVVRTGDGSISVAAR